MFYMCTTHVIHFMHHLSPTHEVIDLQGSLGDLRVTYIQSGNGNAIPGMGTPFWEQ